MIAAIGPNREIGYKNDLLWHLPEDFKRFKEKTAGKTVVMSERTLMSLPEKFRPLPGRRTLVLTLNKDFKYDNCEIYHDMNVLMEQMKEAKLDEMWILGGGQIYKLFLPFTDELHLTLVEGEFLADAFFPEYEENFSQSQSEKFSSDSSNAHNMNFTVWKRKSQEPIH